MNVYFRTYEEAEAVFKTARKPERGKPVSNNTRLIVVGTGFDGSRVYGLKLHNTVIIEYYSDDSIVLLTEGWRTHTTKDRINAYTPQNVWVIQENWEWYVLFTGPNGGRWVFAEGIRIYPKENRIKSGITARELENKRALKKKIDKYITEFAEQLPLDLPSGGDCWFCLFRDEATGKTWGDVSSNCYCSLCRADRASYHEHLHSHIGGPTGKEERYYVPSLAWNAMEEHGYNERNVMLMGIFQHPGADRCSTFMPDKWSQHALKRALKKYLYRRLLWQQ